MAARYSHDETDALSGGLAKRELPRSQRVGAWRKLGAAVGLVVVSVGAVSSAYVHGQSTAITLEAKHAQLRTTKTVAGMITQRKPPFQAHPHTWEVVSDPQPGPRPGSNIDPSLDPVPASQAQLQSAPRQQFELEEPPLDRETEPTDAAARGGDPELEAVLLEAFGLDADSVREDQAVTTAAEARVRLYGSPEDKAELDEARQELKDTLLDQLKPPPPATPTALPPVQRQDTDSVLAAATSWNWLHPAETSYARVTLGDGGDDVSLPKVVQHLLMEREARVRKIEDELARTEDEYIRTLRCFQRGSSGLKPSVSRDEYSRVVQWMNENCVLAAHDGGGGGDRHIQAPRSNFMTPAAFKAQITSRLQLIGDEDDANGTRTVQESMTPRTRSVRHKVSLCIDHATRRAAEASNGFINASQLDEAMAWIRSQCVNSP